MTSFKVAELQDGKIFTDSLFLDSNFLLLDKICPFTKELRSALLEWKFTEVYTEGSAVVPLAEKAPISKEFEDVDLDEVIDNGKPEKKQLDNADIRNLLADALNALRTSPENQKMEIVQEVFKGLQDYASVVYTRFVTHRVLSLAQISEVIEDFCKISSEFRSYLLRITPPLFKKSDKNFIIGHTVRSLIYSIVIGQQLKMPKDKLVELGVATFLHEIGQIRLPPQIYLTERPLSSNEKNILATHTILGYKILKDHNFPLAIQLGVLQHHERENGKGYPQRLFSGNISLYGKIISVVCSFEAITAPRHYKEAKSTYEAMIEMLRNADKQYDEIVIKALVQALSLFPIGAYVFLSNGKLAQVTDTNQNDPRTPFVQIIGEKNEVGNPKIVPTDNELFKIARVLSKEEVADIMNALKNKQ
ncbi:HD-GYP domain-containing protein [Treponema zioleckii]|uniref:HD-GYP domain-containing protein n=1 Tax=Treponema zioleckii TaxID=331680 RepID=UPI00168A80C6|nr:HD-GYP domain-containing protein [Treponema zioleckii]